MVNLTFEDLFQKYAGIKGIVLERHKTGEVRYRQSVLNSPGIWVSRERVGQILDGAQQAELESRRWHNEMILQQMEDAFGPGYVSRSA